MTIIDWRLLPASTTADLYRREWIRWRRRLSWDTSPTWDTVETARITWGLPGVACQDAGGRIRGWAFYLVRGGALEVGGLVADDAAATAALLDAIVERARNCERLTGFVYAHAPGLEAALAERRICARHFLYLARDLDGATAVESRAAGLTSWTGEDPTGAARLLQHAYGEAGRIYAPDNALTQWQQYVTNLVGDAACGTFSPTLSRAVAGATGNHALAIVTAISRRTAHLAQIAVHPAHRGRGLARRLLEDVLVHARQEGFTRMSLLVAADNLPARELYRRLGFAERERFVAIEGP